MNVTLDEMLAFAVAADGAFADGECVGDVGSAAAAAAVGAGDFEAGGGAFDDQVALELGERGGDVEKQFAGRRRSFAHAASASE